MSKVKSPLYSQDAKGSFAKSLSFFKNFKTNSVGIITKPRYQNTQLQQNIRNIYLLIVNDWDTADETVREYFNSLAEGKGLHGYNIFFTLWFKSIYQARYGDAIYGIARYN